MAKQGEPAEEKKTQEENQEPALTQDSLQSQENFIGKISRLRKKVKGKLKKKYFIYPTIAIVATIIVIILFFQLFTRASITISGDITTLVKPSQQTRTIYNDESANISFKITNSNLFQCNAACEFTLFDHSLNKSIKTMLQNMTHGQTVEQTYQVKAPGKGNGQLIYEFKATCSNVRTIICATSGIESQASGFASVNYLLNAEEEILIEQRKEEFEAFITQTSRLENKLNTANNIIKQMPQGISELRDVPEMLNEANKSISTLQTKAQTLLSNWEKEEYLKSADFYDEEDQQNLLDTDSLLNNSIQTLQTTIIIRNTTLTTLLTELEKKPAITEAYGFYSQGQGIRSSLAMSQFDNAVDKLHNQFLIITRNLTHSAATNLDLASKASENISGLNNHYIEDKTAFAFSIIHAEESLIAKGILNITNSSTNITSCTYAGKILNAVISENQRIANLQATIDNEDDNSTNSTLEITAASPQLLYTRSASKAYPRALATQGLDIQKLDVLANITNATASGTASSTDDFDFGNTTIITSLYDENIQPFCINATLRTGLVDNNLMTYLGMQTSLLKNMLNEIPELLQMTQDNSSEQIPDYTLLIKPSQCCAFGNCQACCQGNECDGNYPIIFVHGHSFYEKNSPEISISLFDKMQRKMEIEGYINLGKLEMEDSAKIPDSAWQGQRNPFTVTTSYYYITNYNLGDFSVTVRKGESIETYAIRLREIIEEVKRTTGHSKVIIVAHSMGGLVSREYLLLFGSGSVDRLITINTPHQGITGRTASWCSIFGSSKECDEMAEGSVFMNRLNSRIISGLDKIYSIRSSGCRMQNGQDGDGVVTAESATLESASYNYQINGTCNDALGSDLHNGVLDPERHPEMYDLILELIRKQ